MAKDHYDSLFAKLSEHGFDSREFVRQLVERGLQELVDAGVAAHIGADPHERTPNRTDRRSGMLGLYLASPLNRDTYLASKFVAVIAVLGVMTIGPTLLMLIAFTLEGNGPGGAIDWLIEFGRVLASGLAMAVFWGSLALAVSSLSPRRTLASVAIFVSLLVSAAVGDGLAEGAELGDSFALLNMVALPIETVYRIYGEVNPDGPPIRHVETLPILFTFLGLIVVFGWFARWRYQRIEVTG